MKLRRFNKAGTEAFRKWLGECRINPSIPIPHELLDDETLTDVVEPVAEVKPATFRQRREAAEYLVDLLQDYSPTTIRHDAGLWNWLSLLFFDDICPAVKGRRKVRNNCTYLFEPTNSHHFYRHLLFISWQILTLAPSHNRLLLDTSVASLDGFTTEVLKRLYLTRIGCLFEVLDRIYWDENRGRLRRGLVGSNPVKPGDLTHRFPKRIRQLERTYDLQSISADQLIELLGSEFEFKESEKSVATSG